MFHSGGEGGCQKLYKGAILIFWLLRAACKISEPYDIPFWEKSNARREKEREKTSLIVDIYFRVIIYFLWNRIKWEFVEKHSLKLVIIFQLFNHITVFSTNYFQILMNFPLGITLLLHFILIILSITLLLYLY